jgi:hypothetical protein
VQLVRIPDRFWLRLVSPIDPLWVPGLGLLVLLAAGSLVPLRDLGLVWAEYAVLGTVFPSLLVFCVAVERLALGRGQLLRVVRLGQASAVGAAAIAAGQLVVHATSALVPALAVAQIALATAITFATRRRAAPRDPRVVPTDPLSIPAGLLVAVAAWLMATRLIWWTSLEDWMVAWSVGVLLVALFAVTLCIQYQAPGPGLRRNRGRQFVGNATAATLLGIASLRTDGLFEPSGAAFYHWGVFTGPAELVRQGGWPLWDVPSQYGYLSLLAIADFPTDSPWQSFFAIEAILLLCTALFIFFVLRTLRSDAIGLLFALSVALAAAYLMPGWAPDLLGPHIFPSTGAFRFFWPYALLAILVWYSNSNPAGRRRWALLLLGCITWLVGTLWSAESAAYCAATWLPAYAIALWADSRSGAGGWRAKRRAHLVAAVLLPFAMLASAVGMVAVVYSVLLGHLPDWGAFVEYSMAFVSGFGQVPLDNNGPVLALLLILFLLSATVVVFLRQGLTHPGLPPAIGAWGSLWAMTSYFVGRSHPNNATNLATISIASLSVSLYLLGRHRVQGVWARYIRIAAVPVMTVLLVATFGNADQIRLYVASFWSPRTNMESLLPAMDRALVSLLDEAGVRGSDPIVFVSGFMPPAWPPRASEERSITRSWSPTYPFTLLDPLPLERRRVYVSRFTEHLRLGGWLIESIPLTAYASRQAWFVEEIRLTHRATAVFEGGGYRLTRFEYVGNP